MNTKLARLRQANPVRSEADTSVSWAIGLENCLKGVKEEKEKEKHNKK